MMVLLRYWKDRYKKNEETSGQVMFNRHLFHEADLRSINKNLTRIVLQGDR